MEKIVISCSCCGLNLEMSEDCQLLTCPACGTDNARPRSTGNTLVQLQRAVEQRLACDFAAAEISYQHVLLENPDEHEALWGRLLCHYGVEYVEDPKTKRRMPTVHTARTKPLQSQADFRHACEFAPDAIRVQYEQEARYIDEAQNRIREIAANLPPFDVFLCHKTTKFGSMEKTEDFYRTTQLYHLLKDNGVRVFFAPECLQNVAGANYEAGIYHAIHTAKTMLVTCSVKEYLESAWVRSEWSRYLELMDERPELRLIPLLYDHFHASDLPKAFRFRGLQGMDMTDITAAQKLLDLLAPPKPQPQPAPQPAPQPQFQPQPARTDTADITLDDVKVFGKGLLNWAGKGMQTLAGKVGEGVKATAEKGKEFIGQVNTAAAPKAGAVQAAPTPPAEGCINVTFPEALPAWQTTQSKKVKWLQYKLYKKGQKEALSEIKWGENVQVPAKDGDVLMVSTQLSFVRSVLSAIFLLLAIFFMVAFIAMSSEPYMYYEEEIFGALAFCVIFTLLYALARTKTALKIPVTPSKHYVLSWNLFKNRLQYKQY